jgi:hypothetical protein
MIHPRDRMPKLSSQAITGSPTHCNDSGLLDEMAAEERVVATGTR